MRQFILIFIVTAILCFICLRNSNHIKSLYEELMATTKQRRVVIVDEKRTFEEPRDYSWGDLEMFVVGLTACIVSFTIGWSANSIRKGYVNCTNGDVLTKCLGEHCDFYERLGKLEERFREINVLRVFSEKTSSVGFGGGERICAKDELIRSESETTNTNFRLSFNDSCAITSPKDLSTTFLSDLEPSRPKQNPSAHDGMVEDTTTIEINTLKLEKEEPVISSHELTMESRHEIAKGVYEESLEVDRKIDQSKLSNKSTCLFGESSRSFLEDSHEASDISKSGRSVENTHEDQPSKATMGVFVNDAINDLGEYESQNKKKSNLGDKVHKLVEPNPRLLSCSTRMATLEASKREQDYSYLGSCIPPNQVNPENSCWYTETENYLEEKAATRKSAVDGNISTVWNEHLDIHLDYDKTLSTKTEEWRREDEKFSNLDVSQSMMAVTGSVDPNPDSARSEVYKGSSSRINSRGRIPQYQMLHKDTNVDPKPKNLNLKNENDQKNLQTMTVPYEYIDELSNNVSGFQKDSPRMQNRPNTASGESQQPTRGQRRKKQKSFVHQNASNRTDSKPS